MAAPILSKPSIVHTQRRLIAVAPVRAKMDAIPQAQKSARTKLDGALKTLDVAPLGNYLTLWRPPKDGFIDLRPGRLVSKPFVPVGDVGPSELPPGRTAHLVLTGPWDGVPAAWQALFDWGSAEGLTLAGVNWEIYGEDAGDPQAMETEFYALLA